jgi:hypothetical protein
VTQIYDVPTGWVDASVSSKPLVLVNAYAFSKSAHPPPDQWTHFARLRPVPWRMVATFAVIAAVCVWGGVGMMLQYGPGELLSWFMVVILGIGALFFGAVAIGSLVSHRVRTGWPGLNGVGIGESGISFRLTGADTDVPWDAVTAIEATVTNKDNSKAKIRVLRVEHSGTKVDLNTQILGASPLVVFWALTYYWRFSATRGELGTTVAQQRMDGWLGQVPQS